MSNRKLLTIGIPIYKRYKSLSTLLTQLNNEIIKNNLSEYIEILICDNTGQEKINFNAIANLINNDFYKYIDNKENIGLINNFLKIFEESTGKFCMVVGDDEELNIGKLNTILNSLKVLPDTFGAIIFDKENINEKQELNCIEAALKYFWYFGNLGCFLVNIDLIKKYIQFNKRNTIWPQTELVFNSICSENKSFLIINECIFHSPNHKVNTRYNSHYVLEAGYLSLIKTALNLNNNELQFNAIKNIYNRYNNLLSILILQFIFNDSKQDTKKTKDALIINKKIINTYIFDKSIFYFIFLTRIPKLFYIIILIISRKYMKLKKIHKNINNDIKVNDDYT